jgi:hypothetical protein
MSPERRAQRRKNRTFVRNWRRVCVIARWLLRRSPPSTWQWQLNHANKHSNPRLVALRTFIERRGLQYFLMGRFHSYDRGLRSEVFTYHHEQNLIA